MSTRGLFLGVVLSSLIAANAQAGRCPNIMLVIDKSGSMLQDPNGGGMKPSKWDLVVSAVQLTLGRYAKRIPFGLTTFGSLGGGGASCTNDTWLEVDLGKDQGDLISQKLRVPPDEHASTNTTEALEKAMGESRELGGRARTGYMVLITDGTPNCRKPEPDRTIAAITAAAAHDPPVHTFVVGFDAVQGDNGVDVEALNRMALAGKEPRPGCDPDPLRNRPCYYSATNGMKFNEAIKSIIGAIVNTSVIGGCDDSCFALGCPNGQTCAIVKAGAEPSCQPDPCQGRTCPDGAYCSLGQCVSACPSCPPDQVCQQGACVPDPCPASQRELCAMQGLVCDDQQLDLVMKGKPRLIPGPCAADRCAGNDPVCPLPTLCDPLTGECADDPCRLIDCPRGSTCYAGSCMNDPAEAVPPGMERPEVARSDMSVGMEAEVPMQQDGCLRCGVGQGRASASPLLVALAILLAGRARRRRGGR